MRVRSHRCNGQISPFLNQPIMKWQTTLDWETNTCYLQQLACLKLRLSSVQSPQRALGTCCYTNTYTMRLPIGSNTYSYSTAGRYTFTHPPSHHSAKEIGFLTFSHSLQDGRLIESIVSLRLFPCIPTDNKNGEKTKSDRQKTILVIRPLRQI